MRTIDATAAAILHPPKGMLVVDEYAEALVARTDRAHRFTEALLATPGLETDISAVLLTAKAFAALRPTGRRPLIGVRMSTPAGESSVPRRRLTALAESGAAFVEWRENLSPLDVPRGAVHVGVQTLARGAVAAQAEGLLPVLTIAMPDLGASGIAVSQAVTSNALFALRNELERVGVDAGRLLLRINMITPGRSNPVAVDSSQVARLTVDLLAKGLLPGMPGVLLLSGGQPLDQACAHLREIAVLASHEQQPWQVTFGFSRPLVATAAQAWGSEHDDAESARVLLQNCRQAGESVAAALVAGGAGS
ncbi:class I fructose-bisphosphate aldolase [Kribbella sp. NPDC051952]|uniref:class I fructose-bisphosphate aldolase n=1 Tax=Kribbella sp. NPDC051952 TaxID=3154851 RepID=UPI00342AA1CF